MKLKIVFASLAVLAVAGSASLTSCSTTKGLGTDISNMGRGIEKSAKRAGAE